MTVGHVPTANRVLDWYRANILSSAVSHVWQDEADHVTNFMRSILARCEDEGAALEYGPEMQWNVTKFHEFITRVHDLNREETPGPHPEIVFFFRHLNTIEWLRMVTGGGGEPPLFGGDCVSSALTLGGDYDSLPQAMLTPLHELVAARVDLSRKLDRLRLPAAGARRPFRELWKTLQDRRPKRKRKGGPREQKVKGANQGNGKKGHRKKGAPNPTGHGQGLPGKHQAGREKRENGGRPRPANPPRAPSPEPSEGDAPRVPRDAIADRLLPDLKGRLDAFGEAAKGLEETLREVAIGDQRALKDAAARVRRLERTVRKVVSTIKRALGHLQRRLQGDATTLGAYTGQFNALLQQCAKYLSTCKKLRRTAHDKWDEETDTKVRKEKEVERRRVQREEKAEAFLGGCEAKVRGLERTLKPIADNISRKQGELKQQDMPSQAFLREAQQRGAEWAKACDETKAEGEKLREQLRQCEGTEAFKASGESCDFFIESLLAQAQGAATACASLRGK
eukprot:3941829-Rhodomonas_salina.1